MAGARTSADWQWQGRQGMLLQQAVPSHSPTHLTTRVAQSANVSLASDTTSPSTICTPTAGRRRRWRLHAPAPPLLPLPLLLLSLPLPSRHCQARRQLLGWGSSGSSNKPLGLQAAGQGRGTGNREVSIVRRVHGMHQRAPSLMVYTHKQGLHCAYPTSHLKM